MANEYIEVVKKWLANNDSVSSEELRANASAAYAARASSDATYAAARTARAASDAAEAAEAAYEAAVNVDYWVKRYEELINE